MIPFSPEPVDSLKDRFCDSVIDLYNTDDIKAGKIKAPSKKKEHVFDFEDGIRLIVSRELYNGKEFIHMSGSFSGNLIPELKLKDGLSLLVDKYRALSGDDKGNAMQYYVTEAGVLHLIYDNKRG